MQLMVFSKPSRIDRIWEGGAASASTVCTWAADRTESISRSAGTTAISDLESPVKEISIVDRYPGERLWRWHSHFKPQIH